MALRLTPSGDSGQAAEAMAAAQAAHDLAENARQMVLRRDPRLMSLEDVAQKFAEEIARTDQIHADLQSGVDAALARAMTPGPAGPPGPSVKGDKGDPGKDVDPAVLSALQTAVASLEASRATVGYGVKSLGGSLAAGATQAVVVTLSRDMKSTDYSVGYGLVGGTSLLGPLTIIGVTAQTATAVTVQVRNGGLTSLANLTGAVVHVVAVKGA